MENKKSYKKKKKKKIKMSAPTSNEEFELPDGYFVSKLRLNKYRILGQTFNV